MLLLIWIVNHSCMAHFTKLKQTLAPSLDMHFDNNEQSIHDEIFVSNQTSPSVQAITSREAGEGAAEQGI